MSSIPFVDLAAQNGALAPELEKKLREILVSSQYILGAELEQFENEFAGYLGAEHGVGVASGTAALQLAVEALVEPGAEVLVPAATYTATAFAVTRAGCRPRFADVSPDTFTLTAELLEAALTPRTRAVIPVHLFGHPAPMREILEVAKRRGLRVIEDCAQAHGATLDGRRVGSFGDAGCFSFYPSKNLGALGDGGMVVTNDPGLRDRVRMLRHLGQRERNCHEVAAGNERLDTLQAAFLRVKLPYLDTWNAQRRELARQYGAELEGSGVVVPVVRSGSRHVYHLYVIQHPRRDAIQRALSKHGVGCGVYYPIAVPFQPAFRELGARPGEFPMAEQLARDSLALPMFPELTPAQLREIVHVVRAALTGSS